MLAFFLSQPTRTGLEEKDVDNGKNKGIIGWMTQCSEIVLGILLKILGPTLIAACVFLVSTVIYFFFTLVLPAYFRKLNFLALTHLGLDVTIIFNIFFNYYKCITTSPGFAPMNIPEHVIESGSWGPNVRFCHECQSIKPERAHHCSVCNRCVLKMDHHCPWINNCVGYYNHRYFALFLFWLGSGALYVAVMSLPLIATNLENNKSISPEFLLVLTQHRSNVVFTCIISMALGGAVMLYFCWHFYLLLTQQTTIEWSLARMARRKQDRRIVSYSQGMKENFEEFFEVKRNSRKWWWMFVCPAAPPIGDGMTFKGRVVYMPPPRPRPAPAAAAGAATAGASAADVSVESDDRGVLSAGVDAGAGAAVIGSSRVAPVVVVDKDCEV